MKKMINRKRFALKSIPWNIDIKCLQVAAQLLKIAYTIAIILNGSLHTLV